MNNTVVFLKVTHKNEFVVSSSLVYYKLPGFAYLSRTELIVNTGTLEVRIKDTLGN